LCGTPTALVPGAAQGDLEERTAKNDHKLPSYDGLTSLETFLAKYENMASYLKWTDRDKLYNLRASLDGAAGQILWGHTGNVTAESVVALLRTRFGNDLQIERFRAELQARRRGPDESLQSLYNDITRMVCLAHPTSVQDLKDHVAREAFVNALNNDLLQMCVMEKQPANIEEALGIAGRLEAYESTLHVPATPQELSKGEARPKLKHVYTVDTEKPAHDPQLQKQLIELQQELAKLKSHKMPCYRRENRAMSL